MPPPPCHARHRGPPAPPRGVGVTISMLQMRKLRLSGAHSAEVGLEIWCLPQVQKVSAPRRGALGRWGSTESCGGQVPISGWAPDAQVQPCAATQRVPAEGQVGTRRPAFRESSFVRLPRSCLSRDTGIHSLEICRAPREPPAPHSYCCVNGTQLLNIPAVAATLPSVPGSRRTPAFVRPQKKPRGTHRPTTCI